jgi:hypothetical protein
MPFLDQTTVDTTATVVSNSVATVVTSALIPCGSVLTLTGYTAGPSSYACPGSVAGAVGIAELCCSPPPPPPTGTLVLTVTLPAGSTDVVSTTAMDAALNTLVAQAGTAALSTNPAGTSASTTTDTATGSTSTLPFFDQATVDTTATVVSNSIDTVVTGAVIPCGSVLTLSGYTGGPSSYACTGSVAGAVGVAALCCSPPPSPSPEPPPPSPVTPGLLVLFYNSSIAAFDSVRKRLMLPDV